MVIEPGSARPVLVLVMLAALGSGAAHAQSPEAQTLFDEGERLQGAGHVDQACDAFAASNRLEPRAGTMIRLGSCREAQGRLASAWSAYADALERVKDPRKKAIAQAKIVELEPRLSYLTVLVADEVRIEGLVVVRNGVTLDPSLWNRAVPIDGGTQVISARAPGHEEWRTTVEVAPERDKASVEVPRFKNLRRLINRGDRAAAPPADHRRRSTVPTDPGRTRRWLGLGVAGAGLLSAGVGVGFAVVAGRHFDRSRALCGDTGCQPGADFDEARRLADAGVADRRWAVVFIGTGMAAMAGGAYLWFTAPRGERRLDLALSADRIAIQVAARF
ncbi:MAG TPA: hypothetical protein VL172_19885 [Kofleriaceae bacterium]|nr:hypothetical protein [Kofleriaceae bacterium]